MAKKSHTFIPILMAVAINKWICIQFVCLLLTYTSLEIDLNDFFWLIEYSLHIAHDLFMFLVKW